MPLRLRARREATGSRSGRPAGDWLRRRSEEPTLEIGAQDAERCSRPDANAKRRNLTAPDLLPDAPFALAQHLSRLADGQQLKGVLKHVGYCANLTMLG
jgi:hypothetical protein